MALQTKAEKLTATIAADAASAAKYISNAITLANRMSDALTGADNETLAEFLNSRGARLEEDLTEHAALGVALNTAAESAIRSLGIILPVFTVASMADRLLATNRTATLTETGWVIADIPQPDPEPESTPDPEIIEGESEPQPEEPTESNP